MVIEKFACFVLRDILLNDAAFLLFHNGTMGILILYTEGVSVLAGVTFSDRVYMEGGWSECDEERWFGHGCDHMVLHTSGERCEYISVCNIGMYLG